MAALNYFAGVKRGGVNNVNQVSGGSATVGTAVDVEVRMQINDGATATGLTRKDVLIALDQIRAYIESGGNNHSGANLPAI